MTRWCVSTYVRNSILVTHEADVHNEQQGNQAHNAQHHNTANEINSSHLQHIYVYVQNRYA